MKNKEIISMYKDVLSKRSIIRNGRGGIYHRHKGYYPGHYIHKALNKYLNKSVDDAFSYYCKLVPKYMQNLFWEELDLENKKSSFFESKIIVDRNNILRKVKLEKKKTDYLLKGKHHLLKNEFFKNYKNNHLRDVRGVMLKTILSLSGHTNIDDAHAINIIGMEVPYFNIFVDDVIHKYDVNEFEDVELSERIKLLESFFGVYPNRKMIIQFLNRLEKPDKK